MEQISSCLTHENMLIKFVPAHQPNPEIQIYKQVEETLESLNIPKMIPKLHNIFLTTTSLNAKPTIGIVMEHLHGPNLTDFLTTKLMKLVPYTNLPPDSYDSLIHVNDNLILTLLAQIASILLPLQNAIEFNHRDLHGQNIIMCPSTLHQNIIIGEKSIVIPSLDGYWPKIIDFGFARTRDYTTISIFNEESGQSNFVAGRDLCHLVYYLLVYVIGTDPSKGPKNSLRRIPISSKLRKWLMSLITIQARQYKNGPLVNICLIHPGIIWDNYSNRFIQIDSTHEQSWTNIYLALNSQDIKIDASTPDKILCYYATTV